MGEYRYKAFLSCSTAPTDERLVDFFRGIIKYEGFDPYTVGVNFGGPEPPSESIKRLMMQCDCLIVIGTERYFAYDALKKSYIHLVPSWLEAEAGMAHMKGISITLFREKNVDLPGMLGSNITTWIDFDKTNLPEWISDKKNYLSCYFTELRRKIDEARASNRQNAFFSFLKVAAPVAIGAWILGKSQGHSEEASLRNSAEQWPCFGKYDGRNSNCKECAFKTFCRERHNSTKRY